MRVRHVFAPDTWISPQGLFVVFGGGEPGLGVEPFDIASIGSLGLNNSGDVVRTLDRPGFLVNEWRYGT